MPSADALRGLAPHDAVPRFRAAQSLSALSLGPEEGFVLSRVDGQTRLSELLDLVPFDPALTVEIIKRLWVAGAIEIPGHSPPIVVPAPAAAPKPAPPADLGDIDLTPEQAQQIDAAFAALSAKNAFDLLGVGRDADKREVKRAYFKLSKEFHPDRFYGKRLGVYKDRLAQIFQAVKAAFELLSDDARRQAYLESLAG